MCVLLKSLACSTWYGSPEVETLSFVLDKAVLATAGPAGHVTTIHMIITDSNVLNYNCRSHRKTVLIIH